MQVSGVQAVLVVREVQGVQQVRQVPLGRDIQDVLEVLCLLEQQVLLVLVQREGGALGVGVLPHIHKLRGIQGHKEGEVVVGDSKLEDKQGGMEGAVVVGNKY